MDKRKALTTDALLDTDGIQIEQVEEFKYLSSLVATGKMASKAETNCWIKLATSVFTFQIMVNLKEAQHLPKSQNLSFLHVGFACLQCWDLIILKQGLNQLKVFQMQFLIRSLVSFYVTESQTTSEDKASGSSSSQPLKTKFGSASYSGWAPEDYHPKFCGGSNPLIWRI